MKPKTKNKTSGQVVVEYALLLVIAIGFGALLLELIEVDSNSTSSAMDDSSGTIIKHWRDLSKKIACDPTIDEGCPP